MSDLYASSSAGCLLRPPVFYVSTFWSRFGRMRLVDRVCTGVEPPIAEVLEDTEESRSQKGAEEGSNPVLQWMDQ